ncbi:MAG: hypothetical protein OFPI_12920 [Osedax symbiont Rs2]|nr:MAG: hypothetical protein OFPI_12920 [Osedax symbiont Rs2]
MSFEILMGLEVTDDPGYDNYRAAMKPILKTYDGRFGYDFKVSDTLISEQNPDINRVFTINFPDKQQMKDFFSDPLYLQAREKYFIDSVASVTMISSYQKTD